MLFLQCACTLTHHELQVCQTWAYSGANLRDPIIHRINKAAGRYTFVSVDDLVAKTSGLY